MTDVGDSGTIRGRSCDASKGVKKCCVQRSKFFSVLSVVQIFKDQISPATEIVKKPLCRLQKANGAGKVENSELLSQRPGIS